MMLELKRNICKCYDVEPDDDLLSLDFYEFDRELEKRSKK
jgi:hypothetical protein